MTGFWVAFVVSVVMLGVSIAGLLMDGAWEFVIVGVLLWGVLWALAFGLRSFGHD